MRHILMLTDKDVQTIVDGGIVKVFKFDDSYCHDYEIMSESTYKKEILKEKKNDTT